MSLFLQKISNYFFPIFFVRASKADHEKVRVKQKKAFVLLEKYDKGEVKIDYSVELKRLKKFAQAD